MNLQQFGMRAFFLLVVLITGCDRAEELKKGETVEVRISPDEKVRAFVWMPKLTGELGATVSQPYQVWIEFKDDQVKKLMLEGDKTSPFKIHWINSEQLQICYSNAKIYKFRNRYAIASEHSEDIHEVEVILHRVGDLKECTPTM